jgi:hypothetical protein
VTLPPRSGLTRTALSPDGGGVRGLEPVPDALLLPLLLVQLLLARRALGIRVRVG